MPSRCKCEAIDRHFAAARAAEELATYTRAAVDAFTSPERYPRPPPCQAGVESEDPAGSRHQHRQRDHDEVRTPSATLTGVVRRERSQRAQVATQSGMSGIVDAAS